MSKNENKLTNDELKKQHLSKMLESLIAGKGDEAADNLHSYLTMKTKEIINGVHGDEEAVEEQSKEAAFANSGKVMDDDVKGDVKFDNGGKKTLKKHGNSAKALDDKVDKVKFKHGGKKTVKSHEPVPAPDNFDDGRDMELGTTKK